MFQYVGLLLSLLVLSSCAEFKPAPITPVDEMEGPGLFTGEAGEYQIPLPQSWFKKKKKETCDAEK